MRAFLILFLIVPLPPRSTLFPYTTLFRSSRACGQHQPGSSRKPLAGGSWPGATHHASHAHRARLTTSPDRKSTRLNSSHDQSSYAVFCLKKKTNVVREDSPEGARKWLHGA